jgi:hypothetical protein
VETAEHLSLPVGTIGSWSNASSQFTIFVAHGYRGAVTGTAEE